MAFDLQLLSLKPNKSYLETILDCFSRMDIEGLRLYLKDEYTYHDTTKEVFLERLAELFDSLVVNEFGNNKLEIFPGACCGKSCDPDKCKTGFRFMGDYTGENFDLRFIIEADENGEEDIKDIYTCFDFLTNEILEEEGNQIVLQIYEDDKVTFQKSPDYQILLNSALQAYEEFISKETLEIRLDDIKAWLTKYELTNQEIGWFNLGVDLMKWTNFSRIYYVLDLYNSFLEEFESNFERFKEFKKKSHDEIELISWILEIEVIMEAKKYWHLYGNLLVNFWNITSGKVKVHPEIEFKFVDQIFSDADEFLKWFEETREQLLEKYFALTEAEFDEMSESPTGVYNLYSIEHLNFHLEIREKARKNGIIIPYFIKQKEENNNILP